MHHGTTATIQCELHRRLARQGWLPNELQARGYTEQAAVLSSVNRGNTVATHSLQIGITSGSDIYWSWVGAMRRRDEAPRFFSKSLSWKRKTNSAADSTGCTERYKQSTDLLSLGATLQQVGCLVVLQVADAGIGPSAQQQP